MARIDIKKNIIQGKIVYYGPGLCGKTTNLEYINRSSSASKELVSLATEGDRTIFFDYLPIELGKIRGINTNFKLYTVPGQVRYNLTRKMVLKNVDGVVFVADSQRLMLDANLESLENLFSNMREIRINPDDIPVVLQYNKRDLKDILSPEELDAALNPKREKVFLASAMTGEGVLETLQFVLNVVFKKIAAEFGGDAASKPKKKGSKNLVSHQASQTPSNQKEKAADKQPPPPSTPEKKSRPVDKVEKDKSDTLRGERSENVSVSPQKKNEAATTAFGGITGKAKTATPREEPTAQVSTSSSRKGDAASTSRSETETNDSSTQSAAKTKTTTAQGEGKKDTVSASGADQKEQDKASADISTDAIKEIEKRLDKQTKEMSKTISEQFDALNRNIERLLAGRSKNDPGIKQDLRALISPIQSVVDNINNRLISITKENTLTQINSELKDLKRTLDQQSKQTSDFLLTSTEINNLRGEMTRWMQETKNNATASATTGLSGQQMNNIVERFKKELPSATDIKEIRNALAFLVKSAKELPKSETSVGEVNEKLKTALDKLDNDAFRKEIMGELSKIKESVPSKQQQDKIQNSIALLMEKHKEDNRKEDELKSITAEMVGMLRELKNNFVSKEELTLFRKEISDIYQQIRAIAGQRPKTEPETSTPVEEAGPSDKREQATRVSQRAAVAGNETTSEIGREAEPMTADEPPSSSYQNEMARTTEENTNDKSTEEVLDKNESDQDLSSEIEAEAQPDESVEDEELKSQPNELKTATDKSETATTTREAEIHERNQEQEEISRTSEESLQAVDTPSSSEKEINTDEITDDSNGRDEDGAPANVAEESAVSAQQEEIEPAITSEEAPSQEAAAEESRPSVEAQAPPEEDADDKNALRIARVMVSDLDLYYAKDVIEGIRTGDFHERLKNQLEEMHKTFSSRVSEDVCARRDYLGEAIETFVEKKKKQLNVESNAVSEKVA